MATPDPEFTVDVRREGELVVVAPRGEIDLSTVERVREAVEGHGRERLLLDLRDVDFLDSSGLTLILALHRRAEEVGVSFTLGRGPEPVQRIFAMTGLADRLRFEDLGAGAGGRSAHA